MAETTPASSGLPTYQQLFGSAKYHTVDPSRSVLSPAAYFVDLMRLVATYINIDEKDKNSLRSRRPDLWKIPLDGQHTDTLVSKLEIVNEVLKQSDDLTQKKYPFNLPYN